MVGMQLLRTLVLEVTSGVNQSIRRFSSVPFQPVVSVKGILASGRCWVVQCGGSKLGRRTRVKAGVALGMRLCCYAASAFALRMCSPGSKGAKLPSHYGLLLEAVMQVTI